MKWPAGAGAKGNDGVAATVHNIKGGIGYVENAYATQNNLTTTQLRNKAGKFVEPDDGDASRPPRRTRDWAEGAELRDQPERPARRRRAGRSSPPTFMLLPKDPKDQARSAK